MAVHLHSPSSPQASPRDITSDDAGYWVAEEFFAIKDDIFAVGERIRIEQAVIEDNEYRAADFPMAHFAHEALLEHLRARFAVLVEQALHSDRTLH